MIGTSGNASVRPPDDAAVAARARSVFANACEHADSYHVLRLGVARRAAATVGRTHSTLRIWAPLTGAAACCALVVGVVWMRPVPRVAPGMVVASAPIAATRDADDDLATEVASGQIDMVQDLDFYRWLATQPTVANHSAGGGR